MSSQHDGLSTFRAAYLDYLEGIGDQVPSLDGLNDTERKTAEAFVESTQDAAGIDPYASRPSIEQLLDRIRSAPIGQSDADVPKVISPPLLSEAKRRRRLREVVPLNKAIKRGWVPRGDVDAMEAAVCDLLEVSYLAEQPPFAAAARRSNHGESLSLEQGAWLGRIRQIARLQHVQKFDPLKLTSAANRLPRILRQGRLHALA